MDYTLKETSKDAWSVKTSSLEVRVDNSSSPQWVGFYDLQGELSFFGALLTESQ